MIKSIGFLVKFNHFFNSSKFQNSSAIGNVSGDSPDEFCSSDEVKVFKDEGEDEQEQNASECLQAELLEEKSSLITESEQVNFFTKFVHRFFLNC